MHASRKRMRMTDLEFIIGEGMSLPERFRRNERAYFRGLEPMLYRRIHCNRVIEDEIFAFEVVDRHVDLVDLGADRLAGHDVCTAAWTKNTYADAETTIAAIREKAMTSR